MYTNCPLMNKRLPQKELYNRIVVSVSLLAKSMSARKSAALVGQPDYFMKCMSTSLCCLIGSLEEEGERLVILLHRYMPRKRK